MCKKCKSNYCDFEVDDPLDDFCQDCISECFSDWANNCEFLYHDDECCHVCGHPEAKEHCDTIEVNNIQIYRCFSFGCPRAEEFYKDLELESEAN